MEVLWHELGLAGLFCRTDLAVESKEIAETIHGGPVPGSMSRVEEQDGIKITRLDVTNEAASRQIGRIQGHYVTLEVPGLRNQDTELQDKVAAAVCQGVYRIFQ